MLLKNLDKIRQDIYQHDDHTYFNLSLYNNTNLQIDTVFNTTLTQTLLDNPRNWHMAVNSFTLAGNNIPIFTFKDNFYYLYLTYGMTTITQVVTLIPFSPNYDAYDIYNIQQMLNSINAAFTSAYNALILAEPNAGVITNSAPYIVYDPTNLLFTLKADGLGYGYTGTPQDTTTVNILLNNPMFELFISIEYYFIGYNPITLPVIQVLVKDNGIGSGTGKLVGTVYTITETYSSLFNWYDITRILLVSNTLGVKTQMTLTTNENGVPSYIPILSSFNTTFSTGPDTRGYITYSPRFLNYIDIYEQTTIRKLDFSFYYLTKSLELKKIKLFPRDSANLVLIFKHKTVLQ